MYDYSCTVVCFGKKSSLGGIYHKGNVLSIKRSGNVNHPTEKPVELIKELLENSKGDIVYDPFAGSGTTLVACVELEFSFVGCELEQKYVDIANERISKTNPLREFFSEKT